MSVVMNKPHRNVKWTGSVTAVRSVMMKWMYQCRGVSSNWHHLSDVCYGGGVVVSAAVATTLLNPRLGAQKKLQRNHVFHPPSFSSRGICSTKSSRFPLLWPQPYAVQVRRFEVKAQKVVDVSWIIKVQQQEQ